MTKPVPLCGAMTESAIRAFYDTLLDSNEYDEDELYNAQESSLLWMSRHPGISPPGAIP